MYRDSLRQLATLLVLVSVLQAACQSTQTVGSSSRTLPPSRWATFDGDMIQVIAVSSFYSKGRVSAMDGHNLHDGHNARKKDRNINCLLRDCRLRPGEHSIDIQYLWSSHEAEKENGHERRRQDASVVFGAVFGGLVSLGGGGTGGFPDYNSQFYPCTAKLSFEAAEKHNYVVRIIHSHENQAPEEIQVVALDSDTPVARAEPSCRH